MTYLEKAQEMYALIGQGKMMEAFEKYYHDDIVMVEATGEVRKGKDTNRKFEEEWMANVQKTHGGGVNAITSNEDQKTTMVEVWTDVTYSGQRMKMEEVAVQKWDGDKIIHERFYYNMPG